MSTEAFRQRTNRALRRIAKDKTIPLNEVNTEVFRKHFLRIAGKTINTQLEEDSIRHICKN